MTASITVPSNTGLRIIDNCYVVASSGCHRYNFWNDQAVFNGRDDTGWCSPSRAAPQEEFLEVDLGRVTTPRTIALRRRSAPNLGTGFPPAVRVTAEVGGDQVPLLEANNVAAEPGDWWEAPLAEVRTSRLRLHMANVDQRASGSYFMQIMGLRISE